MNKIILTALLAINATASAANSKYNAEEIYNALNVKEVVLNPGMVGSSRVQKSVGGLTCVRSKIVYPGAKAQFECQVNEKKENFEAIYKAMKVKETLLNPGIAGSSRTLKQAGGLSCYRSLLIFPNAKPTFSCEISE